MDVIDAAMAVLGLMVLGMVVVLARISLAIERKNRRGP
jgi:hypothetical protein